MSNNVSKEKMEEYRQYLKELTEHQWDTLNWIVINDEKIKITLGEKPANLERWEELWKEFKKNNLEEFALLALYKIRRINKILG